MFKNLIIFALFRCCPGLICDPLIFFIKGSQIMGSYRKRIGKQCCCYYLHKGIYDRQIHFWGFVSFLPAAINVLPTLSQRVQV